MWVGTVILHAHPLPLAQVLAYVEVTSTPVPGLLQLFLPPAPPLLLCHEELLPFWAGRKGT